MTNMIATRDAYGEALRELGGINKDIIVLDADLSGSTKTVTFKKEFPERFFNVGIAEQNLIGTAAGLAAAASHTLWGNPQLWPSGSSPWQPQQGQGRGRRRPRSDHALLFQ